MNEQGLWKDILESKYSSWRCFNGNRRKHYISRWLKDIYEVCGECEKREMV